MSINWPELRQWLTLAAGIAAFAAGLIQYRKAQRWKRSEWVAAQIRDFRTDPLVQNALWMLDWKDRRLPLLLAAAERPTESSFEYEEPMLVHALSSRSSPQRRDYTDAELSIRDSFDRLFDGLDHFATFVSAKLVDYADLDPHLGYWLSILGNPLNPRTEQAVRKRILAYVDDYGFTGTQDLLRLASLTWAKEGSARAAEP